MTVVLIVPPSVYVSFLTSQINLFLCFILKLLLLTNLGEYFVNMLLETGQLDRGKPGGRSKWRDRLWQNYTGFVFYYYTNITSNFVF